MTVTPGLEAPPNAAPPAAPKSSNRRGLLIGIGVAVFICLCVCIGGAVVLGPTVGGPFTAALGLPQTCMDRSGQDAETCGLWVQNAGQDAIGNCISTQMTEGTTVTSDSLYDCLVETAGEPQ
jgi:hypothetical protein